MERIANKDARQYVENLIPFKGSNTYGLRYATATTELYVVYSYGHHFPMYIAEWEKGADPKSAAWYQNVDRYSPSTSKHQSQCKPYITTTFASFTTNQMKRIAEYGIAGLVALGEAA